LSIINAAVENHVKRIVVTSSSVTIGLGFERETYSEADFASLENTQDPYAKSKIVQEQIIKEFLE